MFIFFLLAGRYIEHNARLKAATMANDLVVVEPILVQKIAEDKAAAELILEQLAQIDNDVVPSESVDSLDGVNSVNSLPLANSSSRTDTLAATRSRTLPDFMKSIDANVHKVTSRIAQDWQQSTRQDPISATKRKWSPRKAYKSATSL